jgi:hypothetical protein
MAQAVEHLLSKHNALSSNPRKKKREKTNKINKEMSELN